jgi:hypothetical protein
MTKGIIADIQWATLHSEKNLPSPIGYYCREGCFWGRIFHYLAYFCLQANALGFDFI